MTHGASFLTLCICVLCIIAGAANKENYETKITKKEEKGIILEGIRKNNDFCFTNRRNNKCSKNYENSGRRNEETEASEQDFVKMKRKNMGNIVKEWQVIFFEPKCYTNELKDEISGNKLYESGILGYLLFSNSTVILQSLAFAECSNGRVFCAECESTMVLSACRICTKITASPIELSCSDAMLTNVTLHSMNPSSFQQAPLILGKSCISISPKLGNVLVSSSFFSSFTVSSAPFLSSKFIEKATLSNLEFFNISSTFKSKQSISKDVKECSTIISCCLFSSVCDALDGGIVRSINAPSSSLLATNASFVGCYRTTNAEFIGNESNPSKPGRQNLTSEVINTFIWCEWNGSKANENGGLDIDETSSGSAIWMGNLPSGTSLVSFCKFNSCTANSCGGGIECLKIKTVHYGAKKEIPFIAFDSVL